MGEGGVAGWDRGTMLKMGKITSFKSILEKQRPWPAALISSFPVHMGKAVPSFSVTKLRSLLPLPRRTGVTSPPSQHTPRDGSPRCH